MDDELTAESGLDALIALLDERGIEHYECVASECEATVYEDKAGNAHECWEGGTSGIVNIVISVTPNEALSVDDLNGVIRENAKLRDLVREMSFPYRYGDFDCGLCPHTDECWDSETLDFSPDGCAILQMVRELGIKVDG